MAYRTSSTLRVARNIIDGNEYAASIVAIKKQLRLNIPKDDVAYWVMQGMKMDLQYEVAVGSASSRFLAFSPSCLLLVNDQSMRFTSELLAHFVDQVLERLNFSTFRGDALDECLADFGVSRTVLVPSFQVMCARKVQFVLFIRHAVSLGS